MFVVKDHAVVKIASVFVCKVCGRCEVRVRGLCDSLITEMGVVSTGVMFFFFFIFSF